MREKVAEGLMFLLIPTTVYSYVLTFVEPSFQMYQNAQSGSEIFLIKELCIIFTIPLLFASHVILVFAPFVFNKENTTHSKYHIAILAVSCGIMLCYLFRQYYASIFLLMAGLIITVAYRLVHLVRRFSYVC